MSDNMNRLQEIFLAAVEISDPAERAAAVNLRCSNDAELKREVEKLLEAHDNSKELPPVEQLATTDVRPFDAPVVGATFASRFKLREKLGEGGMGVVFVADQSEPVRRRVALKVIKTGAESARMLARFEQERQALALMDHPNIAKVLDAGLSDSGQPYFVMELIKGVPLTQYCDEAKLTPRERLELFVPLCQAVQHAHQKGIIHRDLKPSNILVGLYDGRPVPKVIDFGVAKATGSRLSERSIYTEVGSLIGTIEYMSPEQAELNNLDIDTRSDIYALGVILYELLTGSVPFSRQELQSSGLAEMLRIIKEKEPSKPSTKLSGSGELPSVAASRHTEPAKLSNLVRGDLDWITMKALEKDRSHRYETANAFAMDVQRYLSDEPVLAGPPSAGYRLRKFARRNKGPVLAGSLVLLALLAGMMGTTWGLVWAERARVAEVKQRRIAEANEARAFEAAEAERQAKLDAETKQAEAEIQQRRAEAGESLAEQRLERITAAMQQVEEERRVADAVKDFLKNKLLAQSSHLRQYETNDEFDPRISVLLDRAAVELAPDKIESNFPNQPLVQAELLQTIGNSYPGIRMDTYLEEAISHLERARDIFSTNAGPDHPQTLNALGSLAAMYHVAGRSAEAVELIEKVRDARVATLGTDHPDTLAALDNLASTYAVVGKNSEAIELFEQVRDARAATLGVDHPDTLKTLHFLADRYRAAGRYTELIKLYELLRATLATDHPETISSLFYLAEAYRADGRPDEANKLHAQLRDDVVKWLSVDHPDTLAMLDGLTTAHLLTGKLAEAVDLYEHARDIRASKLGTDHPETLNTLAWLATAYSAAGRISEATELREQIRDVQVRILGADHIVTLMALYNLALMYRAADRLPEAIELLEQVYKTQAAKLGIGHRGTLVTLNSLAEAYEAAGKRSAAIDLFEPIAAEIEKQNYQHEYAVGLINFTINAYKSTGQLDGAERWLRKLLVVSKERHGAESAEYASQMAELGSILLRQEKWTEAEPILRECLTLREKVIPDDWRTFNAKSLLGGALLGQKKLDEAEALLLMGYQGLKQRRLVIPSQWMIRLPEAVERLIAFYETLERPEEVAKWKKELESLEMVGE